MRNKSFLAILFFALTAAPALAQVYDCQITKKDRFGFAQGRMIFILDQSRGTGSVFNRTTRVVSDKPIRAQVSGGKNGRWRFRWTVSNIPGRNNTLTASYRAMLNTQNGKLTVGGIVRGYDNDIDAFGTCKRTRR